MDDFLNKFAVYCWTKRRSIGSKGYDLFINSPVSLHEVYLAMLHSVNREPSIPFANDSAPAAFEVCLRAFFEDVMSAPVPDRLTSLALALEDALDRGDIVLGRTC